MQRTTAQINGDIGLILADMQVDSHIRLLDIGIRTGAGFGTQAVDDGVLDPLRSIAFVGQGIARDARINGQTCPWSDMTLPFNGMHALVQILFVTAIEMRDWPQHA